MDMETINVHKKAKAEAMAVLQMSVKRLHFGSWEEKEAAAKDVKKLAGEGLRQRKILAELGVITPLVAMMGLESVSRRRLAVEALVELVIDSFTNKALMLEAGILSRLPKKVRDLEERDKQEFAKLLSSISALPNSQYSLQIARMIRFLVSVLDSTSIIGTINPCLIAIHNLSSVLENVRTLIDKGATNILIKLVEVKETSEKSLSTLGNFVVTSAGRKALECNLDAVETLIEILTWDEMPKCQELSTYVLMILAHQSPLQRQKMEEAGIVQVLLELALMCNSPLAQKRASKMLQWFKDERGLKVGTHSSLMVRQMSMESPVREFDEGKKLLNKIVRLSLHKNMETITRRAAGSGISSSKLKALVNTTSSKSLPY